LEKYPIFPNAPISEAVLDIRVQLPQEFEVKKLSECYDPVKDRYRVKKEKHFIKGKFELKQKEPPDLVMHQNGLLGYQCVSEDENKIVQARIDGYTFNKLKPYENWNVFCEEAKELWGHYVKLCEPTIVKRIALRYINRIDIPLPFNDFDEYILTNPAIAQGLPQEVANFFMRLEIPQPKINSNAIVILTMGKPQQPNSFPLIFDIDVYRQVEFEADEIKIWNIFEELRNFKNEIFFKSTTDKAKELFI